MPFRHYARPVITALLLLAAAGAHAQYAWIGANGTRQYSDKPPPPGTPADKILKSPGRYTPLTQAPGLEPVDAAKPGEPALKPVEPKGPPSVADRETAYKERKKAEAEAQAKAQQEALQKQQVAERCAAAREAQAQFNSGARIAQVNQNGERSYMSDQERAARSARANQALQDCR